MTVSFPLVGWSRQPIMLSSVVLPLPEGPTKATKDLASIAKSTLRTAWTSTSPVRYDLTSFSARTRLMAPPYP